MKKYAKITVGIKTFERLKKEKKKEEKSFGFKLTWDQFFSKLFERARK